jgi:hypothetical protein
LTRRHNAPTICEIALVRRLPTTRRVAMRRALAAVARARDHR